MNRLTLSRIIDIIKCSKILGLKFAIRYKLGIAKEGIDFVDVPTEYACTSNGLALVDSRTGEIVNQIGCNWICDEHCPLC